MQTRIRLLQKLLGTTPLGTVCYDMRQMFRSPDYPIQFHTSSSTAPLPLPFQLISACYKHAGTHIPDVTCQTSTADLATMRSFFWSGISHDGVPFKILQEWVALEHARKDSLFDPIPNYDTLHRYPKTSWSAHWDELHVQDIRFQDTLKMSVTVLKSQELDLLTRGVLSSLQPSHALELKPSNWPCCSCLPCGAPWCSFWWILSTVQCTVWTSKAFSLPHQEAIRL